MLKSDHNGAARIGVYVCHCGINIGGIVDVPAVVEYTKTLDSVVYVDENMVGHGLGERGRHSRDASGMFHTNPIPRVDTRPDSRRWNFSGRYFSLGV